MPGCLARLLKSKNVRQSEIFHLISTGRLILLLFYLRRIAQRFRKVFWFCNVVDEWFRACANRKITLFANILNICWLVRQPETLTEFGQKFSTKPPRSI